MAYTVEFRAQAIDDLKRLDRVIGQRLLTKLKWLSENFQEITPVPLTGDLKGLFKLRVGDYRIVYSIEQKQTLLTVHLIGHRSEIYR
jgi:mRNA interferase RelE/StbE